MTRLELRAPFRLDLTANALRRLSTNIVDRYDAEDGYVRVFGNAVVRVTQSEPQSVDVSTSGDVAQATRFVYRVLGLDRDVEPFIERAQRIVWLAPFAQRFRGLRPPRYSSLWEALVNAVVFQQISIHAAAAILGRLIEGYSTKVNAGTRTLFAFVTPEAVAAANPEDLRRVGLSINKVRTLQGIARALLDSVIDADSLETSTTAEILERLVVLPGVGPWTATVVALRGFGRLDVFPPSDSGVARTLKELSGDPTIEPAPILHVLGDQRGMLYYHLLLGRLAARGQIDV